MPRTPRVTAAECLKALAKAGWSISRQSESHAILRNPNYPARRVVVPRHPSRILKPKTTASIIEAAGLTSEEFAKLL